MARSSAIAGKSTDFYRGSTIVAEVKNINWTGRARDLAEVTNMDSDGAYKEWISTFKDGGEVSLDLNWIRDEYDDLIGDLESDDPQDYQIIFGDTTATEFDFSAFVTNIDIQSSMDDAVLCTVTFKITGQPTMTT